MKKIIDRKMYDTEKADFIADYENEYWSSDFHYYEETLYRTKNGKYFIHGSGGPLSPYRERIESNGWIAGEDIRPLSVEEAQAWGEVHMDPECFVETFGEVEEA